MFCVSSCQPDGSRIAVGRSHLILRGCILRNTDYVVGVVVYAGMTIYLHAPTPAVYLFTFHLAIYPF